MAFVAMVLVGLVSVKTVGAQGFPFMVASMGASSVLLFAVPHSPLSQPWPLLGGHLISTFIGVTCLLYIPEPVMAAAAAVSLSIAGMHIARCLHPPGGAVALATVLGGQHVAALGYSFVVYPVMVNTLVMLAAAWLLNNAMPGRRYPVKDQRRSETEGWRELGYGFSGEDMRAAVASMDEFVDVSGEQLNKLYQATVVQMRKRQLGDVRCELVMRRDVATVNEATPLPQAWRLLQHRTIKVLPVVDTQNRLKGIVALTDLADYLMQNVSPFPENGFVEHSLSGLQKTPIGLIMTTPVTSINSNSHVADALPVFVERGIGHLPVVTDNGVVVGMLSRTDLFTLLQQEWLQRD